MKGLKVKKEVAEQMASKLKSGELERKNAENGIFSDDFAENVQNEQVKSKLQANKNVFVCDDFADIEKGFGKYISKKFVNGKWVYKYHPDRKKAINNIKSCSSQLLPCDINNAKEKGEEFIKQWQKDWQKNSNKAKSSILGKHISVLAVDKNGKEDISLIHFAHQGSTKDVPRKPEEIYTRAKLLPIAKEMLEDKNKAAIYEVRNNGNYVEYSFIGKFIDSGKEKKVCVIVAKNKDEGNVYISVMRKAIPLESDIAFVKDAFLLEPSKDALFSAEQRAYSKRPFPNRTQSISQQNNLSSKFVQKSTYPDYSGESKMNQTFDINITDITEDNKQRKLEQFSKALTAIADNRPFVIKHIPADGSTKYNNLVVRIRDFDRSKIEKAVHKVALSLDSNVKASSKGESFVYKTQEEITENFYSLMTEKAKAIYDFVIGYFDLPDIRIVSKAGELKYKGKVLYNPETGMPIKDSEWKKFVAELEKLLNRNYDGVGDKIVLSAESLGMILNRLSKTNSFEAIKKMSLEDLKAKRYNVDWISESIKNMKDKFGDAVSRERQARIQIAVDSAAQRVTRVKDDMRNNIQQIVIDGMRDKQSKSVVAQNLFDKCASLNRDMQRIADSEIQMATNSAYCNEEVYNSKPGEKVYFKRFEIIDDNTCKQCKKLNGTVVLWSDVPLPDEHIKDPYAKYAIWDGKNEGSCPLGIVHPFCRGGWVRFYPDVKMN